MVLQLLVVNSRRFSAGKAVVTLLMRQVLFIKRPIMFTLQYYQVKSFVQQQQHLEYAVIMVY